MKSDKPSTISSARYLPTVTASYDPSVKAEEITSTSAATRETRGTPDLPHFAERAEDIPGFISAIWVSHDEWERLAKKDGLVPTADYAEWIGDSVLYFLRKRAATRVSQPVAPPPPQNEPRCAKCGKPYSFPCCGDTTIAPLSLMSISSEKLTAIAQSPGCEPVAPGASAEVPSCGYDDEADVLYVTFRKFNGAGYIETAEGDLFRFHPETHELIGLTVLFPKARLKKELSERKLKRAAPTGTQPAQEEK